MRFNETAYAECFPRETETVIETIEEKEDKMTVDTPKEDVKEEPIEDKATIDPPKADDIDKEKGDDDGK